MTTEGTSEVLETPQMSLKAGMRTFGSDGMKAVEKNETATRSGRDDPSTQEEPNS